MYTIYDYLKYYKDVSLENVTWNDIDNLLCSILIYLPLDSVTKDKTLGEIYDDIKLKPELLIGEMSTQAYKLLEIIINSKRYLHLKMIDLVSIKNNDTQFCAATFKSGSTIVVSFRGTDGSVIGWIENIRISYKYPTFTQSIAMDYLTNCVKKYESNTIYVTGHSKGGNLAMASAMELSCDLFSKVRKVYNFDGPGFRKTEFESSKYSRLCKKLVNIIPESSAVGILLNNKNYMVIKSSSFALEQHYPISWNLFGQFFIPSTLSGLSKRLHESTTIKIDSIDYKLLEDTFEVMFKSLNVDYTSHTKFSITDLKNIVHNMRIYNPDIVKYIDTIIDALISITKK